MTIDPKVQKEIDRFFKKHGVTQVSMSAGNMGYRREEGKAKKAEVMWEWSDKLRLGKSSAFVKKDLHSLPLMEVDFEADFFYGAAFSSKRHERWVGMVIERMFGSVLAMEDVQFPPPTVNSLATLLAHAMLQPLDAGDRQRPRTIYLRDRSQWQELLPHIWQLGIEVVFSEELPRFNEAVIDWMQHTKAKRLPSADEIKVILRKPFPERKPTHFTDAMDIMEWTDAMSRGAYPSRNVADPSYDPMTVVPIHLAADELKVILIQTTIARTKELRPRLETMAAEDKDIELNIHDWSKVLLALCETREEKPVCKHLLRIAKRIADHLAESLGIDAPSLRT